MSDLVLGGKFGGLQGKETRVKDRSNSSGGSPPKKTTRIPGLKNRGIGRGREGTNCLLLTTVFCVKADYEEVTSKVNIFLIFNIKNL